MMAVPLVFYVSELLLDVICDRNLQINYSFFIILQSPENIPRSDKVQQLVIAPIKLCLKYIIMIIRAITKLTIPSLRTPISLLHKFSTSKGEVTLQLRTDLVEKLESMNIRTQKSILMEEVTDGDQSSGQVEGVEGKKKKKMKIFKTLTPQEKTQLGLMIPHSPFNPRLTRKSQLAYRQKLCENLYQAQKSALQTSVRILQLENSSMNVDQYINSTYKDIFARYMISRGCGIEWEARNSQYGVMNPANKTSLSAKKEIQEFYNWLLQLIQEYPLQSKEILGLYSYSRKKYLPISSVDVQNVHKLGYFFTIPLTKFGKYKQNFDILQDRGQKIDLLIMVQDPLKILNIEAICIEPNKKMIILSKYNLQSSPLDEQETHINSFLVTSMDIYTDHRQYFSQHGYKKHSIFQSDHLLEMEAGDGIKIVNEIEGYSRKGGAYVIDRFSGLPDFQRAQELGLRVKREYVNQEGLVDLGVLGREVQGKKISINNPKYSEEFLQVYSTITTPIRKLQMYSTFQDQIYIHSSQKLHFRLASKYTLPIPPQNHEQLHQILSHSIIQESKVQIPKLGRSYPKPRDKRRDKKRIRELRNQETEYLSLKECLDSVEELSVSRIDEDGGRLTLPLFVEWRDGQRRVLINSKIRQVLMKSIIIEVDPNQPQLISIKWNNTLLQEHLATLASTTPSPTLHPITLTDNLLHGYRCFKNYLTQPQLSNIVVEPQSKTEDVVPYFFHLHLLLHQMMVKKSGAQEKGRKVGQSKMQRKLLGKMFSLIKFHPTIDESQRNKQVQQLLFGVLKANNEQQYGYGLQALRLWIARQDSYLGDRKLSDKQVNNQLELSAFIRKLYWQILPLTQINLDKIIIKDVEEQQQIEMEAGSNDIPRERLSYLHNFVLDHIDYYVLNMEECYTKLDLSKAIQLTEDFFRNYLDEIFVKTVRKRIIAFPLAPQTRHHIYVLKRILDLISVVAPLLPYSVYHISKLQLMQWPEVKVQQVHSQLIPNYNRMVKLRVEVRNKFILNNFRHSELVIPIDQLVDQNGEKSAQDLPQIWKMSKQDLQLFFGIENISLGNPEEEGSKSFKLKLTQDHPIGSIPAIKFYEYKEVCTRCSPSHHYGTHICQKCLNYLNNNFGKSLPLN